jgi:MinD-like ATPase involved in chromosome partitioning or flagellar assembly
MSDPEQVVIPAEGEWLGEVRPNKDVAALFLNLHLNDTHYQPFPRRRVIKTSDEVVEVMGTQTQPPVYEDRVQIGIFSPMGGSGTSTLTASLGSILCQLGRRVLLVDTSPWQGLAFHFGAMEARPGKRTFSAPGSRDSKIHILACSGTACFPDLESVFATTPVDCVLFDLGNGSGDTSSACLRECDILLVTLLPEPSAVWLAKAVKLLLTKLGISAARVQFVINQMDGSRAAQEVRVLLEKSLGEDLFPTPINRQPEVHNAVANGVVLPCYAPEAQATVVCHEIVQWLQVPEMNTKKTELRWCEE